MIARSRQRRRNPMASRFIRLNIHRSPPVPAWVSIDHITSILRVEENALDTLIITTSDDDGFSVLEPPEEVLRLITAARDNAVIAKLRAENDELFALNENQTQEIGRLKALLRKDK